MATHSAQHDPRPIPDWRPAEKVVPDLLAADDLMWMHSDTIDGITIQAYKHHDTRGYLLLDDDGNAYRILDRETDAPRAQRISLEQAKAHMLRLDEPFELTEGEI